MSNHRSKVKEKEITMSLPCLYQTERHGDRHIIELFGVKAVGDNLNEAVSNLKLSLRQKIKRENSWHIEI